MELIKRSANKISSHTPIEISSIYLGGGTPSQIPVSLLNKVFSHIYKYYSIDDNAEITIECNPEDINSTYLHALSSTPINRISFGIQSFDNDRLSFLHRRHNSEQSERSIKLSQDYGYTNISIDLMYGFPNESLESWEKDVKKALELDVQHISAYSLSYEEGTILTKMLQNGQIKALSDEICSKMYYHLITTLESFGFEQYEISNFAKPGFHSKHNSNYWKGIPYIGIGPGAHSYDGKFRSWNISCLDKYMKSIENGKESIEKEELSETDKYNEYIMTRLRTKNGINLEEINTLFNKSFIKYLNKTIKKHIALSNLSINNNNIFINKNRLFISDSIISDMFKV